MPQSNRCLVVVSVISGKNFIDKPGADVIVEAKLHKELLSTDPVPHSSNPHFEQELAWEIDRTSLRQYRLERTSIKLQLFSIYRDDSSCSRDLLGYVILDVRSAIERRTFKWFQVLNSKLRPSPEIYCGLYIDPCNPGNLEQSCDLNKISLEVKHFMKNFENHLVDGFQLGNANETQDYYLISIVPVSLPKLADSLLPEASSLSVFRLTLYFLDNELFSWEFKKEDCNKLCFDQRTFFIKSTMKSIKECFSHANIIEIKLFMDAKQICQCRGTMALIGSQINSTTCYPFSMDVVFNLIPPQVTNGDLPVILRFTMSIYAGNQADNVSHSQAITIFSTNDECVPIETLNLGTPPVQTHASQKSADDTFPSQQPVISATTASQIPTNYLNESGQLHRFCYIIELKTIKACCRPPFLREIYVYAKYAYPLFGTTNPIMTLPPVRFSESEEKHFYQGYCAFELAANFSEFKSRLLEEPLNVEILGRPSDAPGGLEPSFGWAVIPLGEVFLKPVIEMTNSQRRLMGGVADVMFDGKPMAQITYSLVLDDFGVYDSSTATKITSLNGVKPSVPNVVADDTTKLPHDIRQTSEYRTALQLELWKATEEENFKNNLKLREQKMMAIFAEEWKRRESERETICKKKMEEYQMLEDKLRVVIEALVEQERQLNLKEMAINATQRDFERNLEIREKDLLNDVQRKIRDAEQALATEQQRNSHLNNELVLLREHCKDLEEQSAEQKVKAIQNATTAAAVDGTTASTKDGSNRTKDDNEEIRLLQFELVRLTTELTSSQSQVSILGRRLDGALRGRLRYKELWTRALQEVARLRQEAANTTKQELQRREAEVNDLRRERYLGDTRACSHHSTMIPQHQADLPKMERTAPENSEGVPLPPLSTFQKANDPIIQAQLKRLRDERESLLASGVYQADDELIADLDKEIQRLQVGVSNSE